MDGVEGFEPPNNGTKNRCLTAWRYPNTNKPYGLCGRHYSTKCSTCQGLFLKSCEIFKIEVRIGIIL